MDPGQSHEGSALSVPDASVYPSVSFYGPKSLFTFLLLPTGNRIHPWFPDLSLLSVQGSEQGTDKSSRLSVFESTNEGGVSAVLGHHEDALLAQQEASLDKHEAPSLPWVGGWQKSQGLL